MMPVNANFVDSITFNLQGLIQLSDDNKQWPSVGTGHNSAVDFFHISDSSNIKITGDGTIEGQGYWWWMREYIVANEHGRPHMISMERV